MHKPLVLICRSDGVLCYVMIRELLHYTPRWLRAYEERSLFMAGRLRVVSKSHFSCYQIWDLYWWKERARGCSANLTLYTNLHRYNNCALRQFCSYVIAAPCWNDVYCMILYLHTPTRLMDRPATREFSLQPRFMGFLFRIMPICIYTC